MGVMGSASASSFPLGFAIEPKLQECIHKGLFVPFDVILLSEQGASVDQYLKSSSVVLSFDARAHPTTG